MGVAYNVNPNGSIAPFTTSDISNMKIETLDIRQGGFPTHTRDSSGCTLRASYLCDYGNLEKFLAYMLGAACSYTEGGNLQISRLLPQTWPGKPQIAVIKLDSATGHQFVQDETGTSDQTSISTALQTIPSYSKAKCVFTMQQVPYAMVGDALVVAPDYELVRYVQVLPSTAEISYLGLPGGIMRYKQVTGTAIPDGKPIPYPLGFPVPTINVSRKWFRVPYECWGPGTPLYNRVYGNVAGTPAVTPFAGTVNVDTLFGYAPGYLLYLGVDEELEYDPLGDVLFWNLTHKWQAKTLAPHLWLYFFSSVAAESGSQGWYLAVKAGSSYSTIPLMPDDTALFNVRQHHLLFRTY